MTGRYKLSISMRVDSEPHDLQSDKEYGMLTEVVKDVHDFLAEFGQPDHGKQSIVIVLVSEPTN